jgi:sulfatase modifying factor 1
MRCFHFFHGRWTRSRVLSVAAGALATVASMAAPSCAGTVTFGTGSNQFQMEFVTIGDPGNAADFTGSPSPAGSVGYTYGIGKFEVSEDMITKFNASQTLQITTRYTLGAAKAASGISWNEAARFVNWLNTSTGNQAAYKFTTSGVNDDSASWTSGEAGYDVNNPYRNRLAMYVLPSYNEWYKAAYYDPNKSGGAGYWDYATGSDSAPAAVSSGTGTGANGNNEAVYGSQVFPADVNQAGGLSPYGVMGLNGNVTEWHEDSVSLTHGVSSSHRGLRGGSWFYKATELNIREFSVPTNSGNSYGFRVARLSSSAVVPEPTSMVIFGLGALGMAYRARRKRRCKA